MFSRVGKNFKDSCQILGKQTEENKNKGTLESFLSLSVFYRKSVVAECESFAEMVNNNNNNLKSLLGFFPQFYFRGWGSHYFCPCPGYSRLPGPKGRLENVV